MAPASRDTEWTAWMLRALAGDAVAYRRFLLSVTPFIRAVVRKHCRHLSAVDGEAEDIVQDALLAIHLKRQTGINRVQLRLGSPRSFGTRSSTRSDGTGIASACRSKK
jgi:DNA-directed RNA polymerase specialized sigma24 family protein